MSNTGKKALLTTSGMLLGYLIGENINQKRSFVFALTGSMVGTIAGELIVKDK